MEDADLRLDGNSLGGLLGEIFVAEVTAARSTCASCGAVAEVGALTVYLHAPGAVARCPRCGAVLIRIVRGPAGYWLELGGVRCLELRSEA
jgi:hypothetical protein